MMISLLTNRAHALAILLAFVAACFVDRDVYGGIAFLDMYRANEYVQTSDAAPIASAGSFLALSLNSDAAGEFDSVATTYPGPDSPVSLPEQSAKRYQFQTPALPDQPTMDAQFPFGTYTSDATNVGGTLTASFDYSADAYPESLPYLTAGSYSALQSMNPAVPLTVHLNPMLVHPDTNDAFVFFTIFDNAASQLVFDSGFMPSTTTEVTIAGGTLENDKTYTFEVIYSDRVRVPSPGAEFDAIIGFDLRTQGQFVTVPEPTTLALAAIGALALVLCNRRIRRLL